MKKIVWTIAGSDSGSGAGIQADLETFRSFGVQGASCVTAITAQNTSEVSSVWPVPTSMVEQQMESLNQDLPPHAIKIGMLANSDSVRAVGRHLPRNIPVICDPVLSSETGQSLSDAGMAEVLRDELFEHCTLITPNLSEAECLNLPASEFKSILLKGGHGDDPNVIRHVWTNAGQSVVIEKPRMPGGPFHGTGCTLSASIAAGMAQGLSELDAIVLAEIFVTRSIRASYRPGRGSSMLQRPLTAEQNFTPEDLPIVRYGNDRPGMAFPAMKPNELGFYPIVDSAASALSLFKAGVKTIQIRIKNKTGVDLEREIEQTAKDAKSYEARLFVNDYWKLALRYGAYGVHLGQEDLSKSDLNQLANTGLRLGISTHSYSEMARAHAFRPSYAAIGPIFRTTLKTMNFAPQGLAKLSEWRKLLNYPVVAIGGMKLEHAEQALACGIDSIAVISDLHGNDSELRISQWLARFERHFLETEH